MEISFVKLDQIKSETAIFLIDEQIKLNGLLKGFDSQGAISESIKSVPGFKGKKGQILPILNNNLKFKQILLVGIGKKKIVNETIFLQIGGKLASFLNISEIESATIFIEGNHGTKFAEEEIACNIALGAKLKNYNFNYYFVEKKNEHKTFLKSLTFALESYDMAKKEYKNFDILANGVYFARDLVTQPPNVIYPVAYAQECKKLEKIPGLKVTVLKAKDIEKLGMNALLGVAKGSSKEAQVVIMEWYGNPKNKKEEPIAFIGKGVTFDSGGISIKPSLNMGDMKYDMAGSATVVGLMKVLAERKARVNAVGVIGLVENMPDGNALKPADVVVSMSGQTIEIENTDAEGRLVLADILWYTQSKFKPKFMINLATLTGAIVVTFGEGHCAGLFSNNDALAKQIYEVGELTNEKVWRLPLHENYDKQINSEIADVRNTGTGRGGGSITAAQFLQRFVNKLPWAHIDIAGMAWDRIGNDINPKGASGYGVRLLNQLVMDFYEVK